jgi:hypothetical protein
LIGLGARKVRDVEASGARWTTFADVEGNEFDLIAGRRRVSQCRHIRLPGEQHDDSSWARQLWPTAA